ncbi:MAG: UrcA family protein [Pseudomonadota bacterium]|nr:UrcA family protein [Pseudomonadota bacterium]
MTNILRFGLLLSVFVASPSFAEPTASELSRVVVRTADLDLSSAAGQRLLDVRLAKAVLAACGDASDYNLAGSNDVRRCRDDARAGIAADRGRLVALASRAAPIVIAAR